METPDVVEVNQDNNVSVPRWRRWMRCWWGTPRPSLPHPSTARNAATR